MHWIKIAVLALLLFIAAGCNSGADGGAKAHMAWSGGNGDSYQGEGRTPWEQILANKSAVFKSMAGAGVEAAVLKRVVTPPGSFRDPMAVPFFIRTAESGREASVSRNQIETLPNELNPYLVRLSREGLVYQVQLTIERGTKAGTFIDYDDSTLIARYGRPLPVGAEVEYLLRTPGRGASQLEVVLARYQGELQARAYYIIPELGGRWFREIGPKEISEKGGLITLGGGATMRMEERTARFHLERSEGDIDLDLEMIIAPPPTRSGK